MTFISNSIGNDKGLRSWLETVRLGVIGLGYVGLPIAVEFGKHLRVAGFDVNSSRIAALRRSCDETLEISAAQFDEARHLDFTSDPEDLRGCNVYIVAVPTPIDRHKRPDLSHLLEACRAVGTVLKHGDLVIFESTVYPGCTEEDCVPVLEAVSGLRLNHDFLVGYSPERINPSDDAHRLPNVVKVVSGSTPEALDKVDALYSSIITAGTCRAESIKVAEAAKVIENTQRDLNIALVNELAIIFDRMGLDTTSVLEVAGTKWNFLPFRPGLVGGHCIGVDPYYLTHKAEEIGYSPEIILAGRRLNDGMGKYVAARMIRAMDQAGMAVSGARLLVMGLTFKENCSDLRNSMVIDIIDDLRGQGCLVDIHDPVALPAEARARYDIDLVEVPGAGTYDGILLAVGHDAFRSMGAAAIRKLGRPGHVFFDIKALFPRTDSDLRL